MRASVIVTLPADPRRAIVPLQGLALQGDEPEHEVVVVDDASPSLEGLLARLDGDVEIVRSPRPVGLAAATALGAARARGDVLVVLHGGAVPAAGWLAPLVSALDDPRVAVATSVTKDAEGAHPAEALAVAVRRSDLMAAGGVPAVAPELALASVILALAPRGDIRPVASSVVARATAEAHARVRPGTPLELSIVIPTLDAASERVRRCVAALQLATFAAHEIVIVDNGAPPQGFSAPVNAGLRATRAPYVVVLNDDVEVLPGWWEPLRARLDAGAPVVFPATEDGWEHPDFSAWCFAMTRAALEEHACEPGEFFDPSLVVHFQDIDLNLRLRAVGRPPVRVPESRVRHALSTTLTSKDPDLAAWVAERIDADRETFGAKHPGLIERSEFVRTG